ncbi:hypothetical protein J6590_064301 [Homalodisca vitripennis]|nr:hypothetical protein J6590_064301 [Homalodisca vitripennis]
MFAATDVMSVISVLFYRRTTPASYHTTQRGGVVMPRVMSPSSSCVITLRHTIKFPLCLLQTGLGYTTFAANTCR